MRIVCISDTHGRHAALDLPVGDVLVHAGDFTNLGRPREARDFADWLRAQPFTRRVLVAGNHDFLLQTDAASAAEMLDGIDYLEGAGVEIDGFRFWGSPWQPRFGRWAFNLERGPELAAHWRTAPSGVDVLITHTPAAGVLDRTWRGTEVGCADLAAALPRIAPRLHVVGHIHEAAGHVRGDGGMLTVNASICDPLLRPAQRPVVVELTDGGAEVIG